MKWGRDLRILRNLAYARPRHLCLQIVSGRAIFDRLRLLKVVEDGPHGCTRINMPLGLVKRFRACVQAISAPWATPGTVPSFFASSALMFFFQLFLVEPILGVTFSKAVSKLKAQSSNVSFHWNVAKETFELWALSFETAFENVDPSGIWWDWLFYFWFWIHTASAPITSGTHTDEGAVIRKPGSAWLEGTPAIIIIFIFCFLIVVLK